MELALQITVGIVSLPLLALGLRSMLAPRGMGTAMAIAPRGAAGLSTIRGVAGGLFFASVSMLALGLLTGQTLWLLAVAMIMGAVMLGRFVGIVADGFDRAVLPPLVVEAVIGSALVLAHLCL
ncbi:MAG: hypothetical protein AAF799_22870 [Myxococcota bacterium]